MGITLKSVPFFSDAIILRPHTATDAAHLGRKVTLREFAGADRMRLYVIDDGGELLAEVGDAGCPGYRFMQGPES